jgi:hypothetical protein
LASKSAKTLRDELLFQRATQTYLWALPLINTLGMKVGSENILGAGCNVLQIWKKRLDAQVALQRCLILRVGRQREGELSAAFPVIRSLHGSSMGLDDRPADGEPHAQVNIEGLSYPFRANLWNVVSVSVT